METSKTSNPTSLSSASGVVHESNALAPTLTSLGFGMAETLIATAFAAAQEVRGQSKNMVTATFDGVEAVIKSALLTGRKLHGSVDEVSEAALSRLEVSLRVVLRAIWKTNDEAISFAGRTVTAVAGETRAAA